eukprot:542016-Pyramimonas_sp.AAC.1
MTASEEPRQAPHRASALSYAQTEKLTKAVGTVARSSHDFLEPGQRIDTIDNLVDVLFAGKRAHEAYKLQAQDDDATLVTPAPVAHDYSKDELHAKYDPMCT